MYDKIYVNGASWVQGHGVEKDEVFSYHLSNLLECEELNVAEGGASNDWVIRQTIDYVLENEPKNHLFVLGFAGYFRWDIWDDKEEEWKKGHPMSFTEPNLIENEKKLHGLNYVKHWKYFVENFYNEKIMRDKFVRDIHLLESFFRIRNLDYILFDTTSGILKEVPNNFKNFVDLSWEDFCGGRHRFDSGEYISAENGHPNPNNHKKWANYLFDKLKEKLWPKF
jgi:hypothetical protein